MADWKALEEGHLHGVVRTRDAQVRMDPTTLRRTANGHGWERPFRGVVRVGPVPEGPRSVLAAALQRVRSDDAATVTALTGWSALWLYGLVDALPSTVELTTNHSRRASKLRRVRVRRSRTLRAVDVTELDGFPVVVVARLFCDIAGTANESALRALLLDARQRGLVTFAEIGAALERAGNIKGARRLRGLLDELSKEKADSIFEHRVRRRLEQDGFHPDPGQAEVPTGDGRTLHVDIPFSAEQVGIECHSLGFHAGRKALETDARRQSELNLTEWIILIATWHDLGEGWPDFRERLSRALRQRRTS